MDNNNNNNNNNNKLGIPFNVGLMQKTALLGTARILRKMLEM